MGRKANNETRAIVDFELMVEVAAHAIGHKISGILPGKGMSPNVAAYADAIHPESAPHKWLGTNPDYSDQHGFTERDMYYAALMSIRPRIFKAGTGAYVAAKGGLAARGIKPGEYKDRTQNIGEPLRVTFPGRAGKSRKGTPRRTARTVRSAQTPVTPDVPLTDDQLEQIAMRVAELVVSAGR